MIVVKSRFDGYIDIAIMDRFVQIYVLGESAMDDTAARGDLLMHTLFRQRGYKACLFPGISGASVSSSLAFA